MRRPRSRTRTTRERLRPLDPKLLEAFRIGVDVGLKELIEQEKKAQEVERQLAIRQTEQAVNTLAVVMESVAAYVAEWPDASFKLATPQMLEALAAGTLPPMSIEERCLLRFELDLMMALASLDGPLDELTYWAHRAVVGSRRVQAMSTTKLTARWRAELARLRARASWVNWDDEELKRELAPWPDDSPSP